jgi:hypothetical protein
MRAMQPERLERLIIVDPLWYRRMEDGRFTFKFDRAGHNLPDARPAGRHSQRRPPRVSGGGEGLDRRNVEHALTFDAMDSQDQTQSKPVRPAAGANAE